MSRRRSNNTRSRSILLSVGLTFVLAQAGAGVLFDYVWPEVRFPLLYWKLDMLNTKESSPMVVTLGSSRFGTALIEEDMTRRVRERNTGTDAYAVNAAVPAGDPLSSEFVLRRLLERGMKPRVLLIEILPEALNKPSGWMRSHVERQLGWEELTSHLSEITEAGELQSYCVGRAFPLYAHRRGFLNFLVDKARPPRKEQPTQTAAWNRTLGKLNTASAEEKARRTKEGLKHVRQCLDAYEPSGQAVEALTRMLALCRAEQIEPILVLAPVSSHHRALYTEHIEDSFQRTLHELCDRFSCRYLDCRDRIPDEDFYDNHHASFAGGRAFTDWLMQRVEF